MKSMFAAKSTGELTKMQWDWLHFVTWASG